jgi:hypothetical protein
MPSDSYDNAISGCLHAGAVQACLHGRLRGGQLPSYAEGSFTLDVPLRHGAVASQTVR